MAKTSSKHLLNSSVISRTYLTISATRLRYGNNTPEIGRPTYFAQGWSCFWSGKQAYIDSYWRLSDRKEAYLPSVRQTSFKIPRPCRSGHVSLTKIDIHIEAGNMCVSQLSVNDRRESRQYLPVVVSNLVLVNSHTIRFRPLFATFTLDQRANWRAGVGCLLDFDPYNHAFRLSCLHTRHLL